MYVKILRLLVVTLILLTNVHMSLGQRQQVIPPPREYIEPKYDRDWFPQDEEYKRFINESATSLKRHQKEMNARWYIISDRNENPIYRSYDTYSDKVGTLGYGDVAYVSKSINGWIQITDDRRKNILGWVPKSNVLLWKYALKDHKTKINLKGVIINKILDIKYDQVENATVYDHPISGKPVGNLPQHKFYFIYNYSYKDGRVWRVLVGDKPRLASTNPQRTLKGWIDFSKIQEWNTRLALEPNFSLSAIEERKANQKYKIRAFTSRKQAQIVTKKGFDNLKTNRSTEIWDGDVAYLPLGNPLRSQSERHRYSASMIRFPVLYGGGTDYYRSGIERGLVDDKHLKSKEKVSSNEGVVKSDEVNLDKFRNYRLVFVVDNSNMLTNRKSYLNQVHQSIESTVEYVKEQPGISKVEFAIVLYQDVIDGNIEGSVDKLSATSDINRLKLFLADKKNSGNAKDIDNVTVAYKGLRESINEFDASATNIMIWMGDDSDLSDNRLRKKNANKRVLYDFNKDIASQIAAFKPHIIAMDVSFKENVNDRKFSQSMRNRLTEITNAIRLQFKEEVKSFNLSNPIWPDWDNNTNIKLSNFVIRAYASRINASSTSESTISQKIRSALDNITKDNKELIDKLAANTSIDIQEASSNPLVYQLFQRGVKKNTSDLSEAEQDAIKRELLENENLRYYIEVFFPKQQPGQVNDPFSFVMFMPLQDIKDFIVYLEEIAIAKDGSPEKFRESMQNALFELFRSFSPENLSVNEVSDKDLGDIVASMIGMYDDDLGQLGELNSISSKVEDLKRTYAGCEIKNITNRSRCNINTLTTFANAMISVKEKLEKIIGSRNYDCYFETDGELYYWIPVDLLFDDYELNN